MSFLTGSRVYGTPHEDSDVDLVVLVTEEEKQKLIEESDSGLLPCRYGLLNVIAVTSEAELQKWVNARDECIASAPIDRNAAVSIHKKHGATGFGVSKDAPPRLQDALDMVFE